MQKIEKIEAAAVVGGTPTAVWYQYERDHKQGDLCIFRRYYFGNDKWGNMDPNRKIADGTQSVACNAPDVFMSRGVVKSPV